MHVFETPGSVSLQIKLPSGRVLVATADEPRTTVDVVPVGRRGQDAVDAIEVTMDERLGQHVVTIEQKNTFRWGPIQITLGGDFECRITCPPGTDLQFAGASVDVRADGELGEVTIRTSSGDVRLDSVSKELEVKTASGDIAVVGTGARASLVSVSGDVEIQRPETDVTARSVSGDVTIGSVTGTVGISTTSGDVDVRAVAGGELRVQTVSGDVRIGIARGTRTWIDAASVSGRLESELGLEDHEPVTEEGGPTVPLHVKTVSGDVSVVRAAAAAHAS